jgi:hypothetical protein
VGEGVALVLAGIEILIDVLPVTDGAATRVADIVELNDFEELAVCVIDAELDPVCVIDAELDPVCVIDAELDRVCDVLLVKEDNTLDDGVFVRVCDTLDVNDREKLADVVVVGVIDATIHV